MCMFDVYRNELHAYQKLTFPVPTPFVYCAKWSPSRFILIMEDMNKRGVQFPSLWESKVDKQLAEKVLCSLSKIHAKWWRNPPDGCWNEKTRPYQSLISGFVTLRAVNRKYPKIIPPEVEEIYRLALWNFPALWKYWDRTGPHTMCHGDSHIGNFYIEEDGSVGVLDFQVKSREYPMRDVSYFLGCSYPVENLERDEEYLIKFYLTQLEKNGVPADDIPSYEECYFRYRLQTFYTLYAFAISAGFSDLMDAQLTETVMTRITSLMIRVDAKSALLQFISTI